MWLHCSNNPIAIQKAKIVYSFGISECNGFNKVCMWFSSPTRGGLMMQWCWVNFQCQGVLLIWIIVGQRPIALAVGAGGGCLDIFSLVYHFSFPSPSLWETARYRLKYCLKGLFPKQPTNQQSSPTLDINMIN